MRSFPWERTPLGQVAGWPQSLKTSVSTMMASSFPKLICWGPEFVQLYNDAYRPALGATKHPAALGQRSQECWPEIWHFLGPMFEHVRATGEAYWSEDSLFVLDRNGYPEETYFTYSYSPIRDESGGVGGVLVTCVETTRRLLGERRLAVLGHLAESAERASSVDEAARELLAALEPAAADIPFAILYLLDEAGTTLRLAGETGLPTTCSAPAAAELSDPGGDEQSVWPLRQVLTTPEPQLVDLAAAGVEPFAAGPWPEPVRHALFLPVGALADGGALGVLIAGISPRRAVDQEYRSFLQLVAAHTAAVVSSARRQDENRRRAEELAALDRAKTLFFSDVSHELRTPLTLLLGPLEELQQLHAGTAQAELAQLAFRNARRLQKLVNNLLEFSRIEARRNEPARTRVDLALLTADIAGTFRSAIERAGLGLIVDCAPRPCPASVDAEMWERILLNLVSNAFKHTFEGAITVRLSVSGARVRLEVRDTGIGIEASELPRLFQRFHRVRNVRSRTHEGTGIGLSLVRELAHLHGGEVRVESELGRGTAFKVELPCALTEGEASEPEWPTMRRSGEAELYVAEALGWLPRDDASTGLAAAHGSAAPSPETAEDALILVADDNADLRDYLVRILRRHWTVEAVADGEAARQFAIDRRPDLIISDVMMPGMDGFELLRILRAEPRTAQIPMMLLSARAGDEARDEGLAAGADDYLVKPFTAGQLVAVVGARLRRIRARALAALRESEDRLRSVIQSAADMIVTIRPDMTIASVNAAFAEAVGRPAPTLIGVDVRTVVAPVDAPDVLARLQTLRGGGTIPSREYELLTADGRRLLVEVRSAPLREGGQFVGAVSTLRDVTAQRAMQADLRASRDRLRRMSRRLVATIEQERARISRDLHDQVGQALLAARLHVQLLDLEPVASDARVRRSNVLNALDDAAETVRGIAYDLRPQLLDEVGLAEAVRAFAKRQTKPAGIRLRVEATLRGPRLHPAVEISCYRIAQEAVSNAVRHARAGNIRIRMRRTAEALLLTVRDDGQGFLVDKPARGGRRRRMGLLSIRERAAMIGGSVEVRSAPGAGTTLRARLPLRPTEDGP